MANYSTTKTNELATHPVGKLLWRYALPAIIGTMVMSLYNIVDRIFIGQGVGADAISGLAITLPVTSLTAAIGMLVGVGSASRISIVLGQKNIEWAEKILGNALTLTFIFAAIYLLFFVIFLDEILLSFGGSEKTIPYAREYLVYLLPGLLLMNLSYGFNNVMRASGYPRKAMLTMLIGAVANIVLDALFIWVFKWGIKGAAVATVLSMGLSTVFVLRHFIGENRPLRFKKECMRLDRHVVMGIVSIGLSPFLINTAASAVAIIMNTRLQEHGGDVAVGAFGIILSYTMLVVMMIVGLCQGMQPLVGYNYGAKDYGRMKRAYLLTVMMATLITCVGFLFAFFFPQQISSLFTTDPQLKGSASYGLRLVVLAFPLVGFQIVTTNFFQSIGKASKSILLSLSRQVLFLIPFLFIFSTLWGLDGVWLSCVASDLAAFIVALLLLYRQRKVLSSLQIGRLD